MSMAVSSHRYSTRVLAGREPGDCCLHCLTTQSHNWQVIFGMQHRQSRCVWPHTLHHTRMLLATIEAHMFKHSMHAWVECTTIQCHTATLCADLVLHLRSRLLSAIVRCHITGHYYLYSIDWYRYRFCSAFHCHNTF